MIFCTLVLLVLGLSTPSIATTTNVVPTNVKPSAAPTTLTLGGLFPLTGTLSAGGVERDAAARMAVKEINANTTLLPDTTLEMTVRDTQTDPTVGATAATELINAGVFGLVGAASSSVSIAIAEKAAASHVPQISYSSTNAALSNKTAYPYFLRDVPPDSVQGVALASIVYGLGIKNVATLSTNDDYGSGGISVFETAYEGLGGTVATSQQFDQGASSVLTQLQAIVDSGAKVIVLNTIVGDAKTVFSQAADVGISPENGYQWFGTDGPTQDQVYTDASNNVDTTLRDAMQGMVGTAPNRGEGAVYNHFLDLWESCYNETDTVYAGCGDRTPNTYATFAYDAVYAFALAAQQMIDASADPTNGTALLPVLAGLEFQGATGPVSFDQNYDRNGVYDLLNQNGTIFVDIGNWDKVNGLVTTADIMYACGYGDTNTCEATSSSGTSSAPSSTTKKSTGSSGFPGFELYLAGMSMAAIVIVKRKFYKKS